jgi:hypothetical protein
MRDCRPVSAGVIDQPADQIPVLIHGQGSTRVSIMESSRVLPGQWIMLPTARESSARVRLLARHRLRWSANNCGAAPPGDVLSGRGRRDNCALLDGEGFGELLLARLAVNSAGRQRQHRRLCRFRGLANAKRFGVDMSRHPPSCGSTMPGRDRVEHHARPEKQVVALPAVDCACR